MVETHGTTIIVFFDELSEIFILRFHYFIIASAKSASKILVGIARCFDLLYVPEKLLSPYDEETAFSINLQMSCNYKPQTGVYDETIQVSLKRCTMNVL